MLRNMLTNLIINFLGDDVMMAMLFAQRVILEKNTFEQVPNTLKPQVYEILVECGMEFLAGDYKPPVTQ
jgi:hypothetical protein